MKVMILSVTAGFGHIATAEAIREALALRGVESVIVDTLKHISPLLEKTVSEGYIFSTKHLRRLYRTAYNMLDRQTKNTSSTDIFQNISIPEKFVSSIENFEPDLIICTHIFSAQVVNVLKNKGRITCPIMGIVTDYTIHPMWQSVERLDYIVTASELLTLQAVKKGIPECKIAPLGIPTSSKFLRSIPQIEARRKLGLNPERAAILIMAGGIGYGKISGALDTIEKLRLGVQIMAVCGTNKRQYSHLIKKNYGEHVKIYGFVDNVDEMMDAADCIITKPGGLTTTEALVKGLPMIMYNPVPGQEERNTDFMLNNGLAINSNRHFPLDEAIFYLFMRPERIPLLRESIKHIAKPHAAEDIADLAEKMGGEVK